MTAVQGDPSGYRAEASTAPARGQVPDRNLAMELVRVTEAAALAAGRWLGRGDKEGADAAAVDAMRVVLQSVSMNGIVVIGEGEKDEAPMLYNGEQVGDGSPPETDIAVDPIDGTELCALGRAGALAVIAVSDRGAMFDPGPCFYMEKLAVGPEAAGAIDLNATATENLSAVAAAKGTSVRDLTVVILDRDRHRDLIAEVRNTGARVQLITAGDVAAAIATSWPQSGVDVLYGIGGTPEGIIAAAALKCMGGELQGRLWPRHEGERRGGGGGRLRRQPRAGHGRPRAGGQLLLRRHRHQRRRAAARCSLRQSRCHDAVARDAIEVRYRPSRGSAASVVEAEGVLGDRIRLSSEGEGQDVAGPKLGGARWYETAVFYELPPRSFFDSNGDGIGDLAGMKERLDYLEWLGVDCLWLLPFYPSPLRDGGYDVSDFMTVAPECGSVDDLAALVDDAHRRGIRIISDLVMNHTSDQHPWFVESRSSRHNPKADWYVWADDDQGHAGVRVIFVDAEPSNWTFDPGRQQYYMHRFFHHQPDLNYDNPAVVEAMLGVVRFWLDLGLDGFRLDAVAYLGKQEGTSCENLPFTHEVLKRVRAEVDRHHTGTVLLAEVNQWPSDVVDYFGDSDECHMAFHFPLMPRMFMAVRREQRFPITEILAQTPAIPDGCQWGIFLRNHDELTLEMVTEDDRDFMYAEYARDPRMRRNVGIRRRLATLVGNDRRVAELLYALLLSLPGAPVLYYGDEILMGDNIYLGDRDAVRTPMQWTPDRNGGFSTADFARLYLPPLMDPVHGYQAVNVEAQQRDSSSFLHWLRRMLEVRRQFPEFATGSIEVLSADNPSVLAYLRTPAKPPEARTAQDARDGDLAGDDGSTVLCVHNLSRFAQPAQLILARWEGSTPVELLGRVPFPAVGLGPYAVTLPPYGVYWFELVGGS